MSGPIFVPKFNAGTVRWFGVHLGVYQRYVDYLARRRVQGGSSRENQNYTSEIVGYWVLRKFAQVFFHAKGNQIPWLSAHQQQIGTPIKKIKAMQRMFPPRSVKNLKHYIGILSFYQDCFKKRSHVLSSLTKLAAECGKHKGAKVSKQNVLGNGRKSIKKRSKNWRRWSVSARISRFFKAISIIFGCFGLSTRSNADTGVLFYFGSLIKHNTTI